MSTPFDVLAQNRRFVRQLNSPSPSPPYPFPPPSSYAFGTAKSVGVGFAAALLSMVLYLLIRCLIDCIRRCDRPPEMGGGAAPSPKVRDLTFIPTRVVGGSCELTPKEDCAICLAQFSDGETIRVLPRCRHAFHRGCLDPWLLSQCASSSLCPVCRGPVTDLWDNEQVKVERQRYGGPLAMALSSILAQ